MKLIIFANRADPSSLGGLSSLLSDHMNKFLNYDVFVIGWNGTISNSRDIQVKYSQGVTYSTISLNQWEYDNGYINFHNRFLWPLCHKFLSQVHYNEEGFKANEQISQLFLSLAIDLIDLNTTIIVQDYHLIPLGKLIKNQFNIKVGFYLHIPMFDKRSLDRFSSPLTQELIESFKAYDYIGFQRGDDVKRFITNISLDEYDIQPYQLLDVNRYKLCWNPVGIDIQKYQTYQPQLGDDKIRFIFAGRYDYIKGHIGFLNSMYTLLEQKVLDADRIDILLIGGESRGDIKEYRDYQNQIKQLINKINKKYKCIQELGKIPRESLGQLLSSAENQYNNGGRQVVMCPSIMDGQNLIVHEAIAASPYNIVVSSEGSGCIEVVGRDNIIYLKQHDFNNYKIVITEAINISMEKQVRRNFNALERLDGLFNSSKWLWSIINNLKRKTLIFDIDGTISDIVQNPNDAHIHEQFFEFIDLTQHNIIILTGRENSNGSNLTAKDMLMNKNFKILSSHGLFFTNNNETYEHPLVKQIKPMVQKIHQEVDNIMKSDYMRRKNIIIEKKLLGVTINASFESKEQQIKIFSIFRSMFRKLLYKQPFVIADENCSIEIRPNIGKLEGFKYFIEDQLYNEQVIFFCDSLGISGTDLELAQYLTQQGHQVWQVKNYEPDYLNARKKFETPLDLCQYLLFNVIHL